MSIRFLTSWNGYYAQQVVASVNGSTEAALVAAGIASYSLDGPAPDEGSLVRVNSTGTALVSGDGFVVFPTPRLQNVARLIALGKQPVDIVVMGDSTADSTAEWFYQMMLLASTGIGANHSVAYRQWADASQQYSPSSAAYLTEGPLGRRYLPAGSASTSHVVSITDSAKVSTVDDLDVRVLINLNGGSVTSQACLASKFDTAGNRSWRLELTTSNTVFFEHSADGTTLISKTSTSALSGALLTDDVWIRATLDVSTGTGTFYTSPDNLTWTQLGNTVAGSATSVFDSTAAVRFPSRSANGLSSIGKNLNFYELQVFGSLDNTAMAAWIDMGSIPPRTSATSSVYYDDCGNAGTITYGGSTMVGSPRLCFFNGSVGGQAIAYAYDGTRFPLLAAGGMHIAFINYGHNEGAVVAYRTPLDTLADLIVTRNPNCAIVGVLQNQRISPATFIEEHEVRIGLVAQYMAEINADVLDMFGLVNSADIVVADGIHPDATVQPAVSAKMAARAYQLLAGGSGRWTIPT